MPRTSAPRKNGPGERLLTLRELNRATLARQLLLERADLPVLAALERLVGMQAQQARAPYVGLWSRLKDFARADLATEIDRRAVVKATLLRGTLHLTTAADYVQFRATLQPVLTSALAAIVQERGANVDVTRLVQAARQFMLVKPRSFAEISTLLTGLEPDGDPGAMRYAVRTHLPMVQVPVQRAWSYPGNPTFTLANTWLGTDLPTSEHLPDLVERYLAAFGPASVKDMQTWSYLTDLQPVFDTLRSDLVVYRAERGRELFDLPAAEPPNDAAAAPVPIRFLPEFDNLLLAHQDRTRVVSKAARSKVYLPGLRVAATVLIDGFVAATWTAERIKHTARVIVTPFEPLDQPTRIALTEEGEHLARFVEPDALAFEVRIVD
ncbi:MAG: winged helix DNA-binding domain-containing protein [Chloroflexi bacterium]|nr:winged helix DNA-binding domain-containing protein [Chloroflexota bacterium]